MTRHKTHFIFVKTKHYFYVPRISLIQRASFRLKGGIEPLRLSSATGLKPALHTTGDH